MIQNFKMNYKILLKSFKYACIPILFLFGIMFIVTFDINRMFVWFLSDSPGAIVTRLLLTAVEIGVVGLTYLELKEEQDSEIETTTHSCDRSYRIADIFKYDGNYSKFTYTKTKNPNVIIIKKFHKLCQFNLKF